MNNIPEKINMFNAYKGGSKLIGITDEVTLPDFESSTETISGPGILGEFDSPTPGFFGNMEQEVPFRVLYGDIFDFMNPNEPVDLTLRGSIQVTDGSTGGKKFVGVRIVMQGQPTTLTPGSMKAGSPMGAAVKFNLAYILIEVDGQKKVELDKFNEVYKINGVDMLAAAKSLC